MNAYINHKTNDVIDTEMTEAEALEKLPESNSFAMDLKKKYEEADGALSENQLYWIMKLAADAADIFECDTTEIFEVLKKGKIKVKGLVFQKATLNITIYPNGVIWMNEVAIGKYLQNGLSIKGDLDEEIVYSIFLYFAKHPIKSFDHIGRKTGVCPYCGLTLTHEISIGLGRGPTCSRNHGLDFPYKEYEASLRKQRENT